MTTLSGCIESKRRSFNLSVLRPIQPKQLENLPDFNAITPGVKKMVKHKSNVLQHLLQDFFKLNNAVTHLYLTGSSHFYCFVEFSNQSIYCFSPFRGILRYRLFLGLPATLSPPGTRVQGLRKLEKRTCQILKILRNTVQK